MFHAIIKKKYDSLKKFAFCKDFFKYLNTSLIISRPLYHVNVTFIPVHCMTACELCYGTEDICRLSLFPESLFCWAPELTILSRVQVSFLKMCSLRQFVLRRPHAFIVLLYSFHSTFRKCTDNVDREIPFPISLLSRVIKRKECIHCTNVNIRSWHSN